MRPILDRLPALAVAIVLASVALVSPLPGSAQESTAASPAPAAAVSEATTESQPPAIVIDPAEAAQIEAWRGELERIGTAVANTADDARLSMLSARAVAVRDAAAAQIAEFAPRLKSLQARVAELSAPDGTPQAEGLAQTRGEEVQALATLAATESQVRLVRLSADELITTIAEKGRALLGERLSVHRRSVLDPSLWIDVAGELPRSARGFGLLLSDWAGAIAERGGRIAAVVLAIALAAAALLLLPTRRFLVTRFGGRIYVGPVPRLARALAAAAVLAITFGVPVGALVVVRTMLRALDVLPVPIDAAFGGIILAVGWLAAAHGLTRALLAPNRPEWRLLGLDDAVVDDLTRWIFGGSAIYAAGIAVLTLSRVVAAPEFIADAVQAVLAVAVAVMAANVLKALAHGYARSETGDGGARWRWLIPIAWLIAVATGLAALVGYLALAWFLASQLIWAVMVLALLYLLLVMVDEGTNAVFRPGTGVGALLSGSMGLSSSAIIQIGILLSAVVRLVLIVVAMAVIIARFGVSTTELATIPAIISRGLSFGGLTLSPSAILGCLVLLVIGVMATRALQRWLEQRFLPSTHLDVGLKTSIRTAVGYLGLGATVAIAFGYAGVGLQNIAIVAGALSVGVGFGLQSIVNNFVSGLILLGERPIKVGDWIVAGAEEGTVRRINVRSTEIQTFDGAVVIVPNSNLITNTVKNWRHAPLNGRALVQIGAAYDADPERVRDLLLEIARSHPKVVASPAPFVQLADFAESSINYLLFAYIRDVGDAGEVRSDLRFAIYKRFAEEGIEIPFAQRTVTLRGMEKLEALLDARTSEPPPAT